MKKIVTVTVGLVLALAPAGTALAGDTGNGNAYGNCMNSSAGGVHDPLAGGAGNGNGGHRGSTCAAPDDGVVTTTSVMN